MPAVGVPLPLRMQFPLRHVRRCTRIVLRLDEEATWGEGGEREARGIAGTDTDNGGTAHATASPSLPQCGCTYCWMCVCVCVRACFGVCVSACESLCTRPVSSPHTLSALLPRLPSPLPNSLKTFLHVAVRPHHGSVPLVCLCSCVCSTL